MSACQQTIKFEISEENLLHLSASDVYSRLCELDWDLFDVNTTDFTHGMHSYPAKFIPQIPARLIEALSYPGELVVDPFSGGGTTGVEALRLGRDFVGLDANPVAVLLGRIKTTPLTSADQKELQVLVDQVVKNSKKIQRVIAEYVPEIPNMFKWYSQDVIASLSCIRQYIEGMTRVSARDAALVAFANTAARVSYQESETRYVSKPRKIKLGEPEQIFVSELRRITTIATALDGRESTQQVEFKLGDARKREAMSIEPQSAGLVVTSPPYPNAYDYHLYHRFRLFWLGDDPKALRNLEIGSHLKHQAEDYPTESYESDMQKVLRNAFELLMPGRYCVVVIGDGIFDGKEYRTSKHLAKLATELGWSVLPAIRRNLPRTRRSVTAAGRRLATEYVLLLQRPSRTSSLTDVILRKPNYRRFPYEDLLASREASELVGVDLADNGDGSSVCTGPKDVLKEARNLAFWHSVRLGKANGEVPTLQRLLEDPNNGRRKHSTYVTHGLHRYKGKFYPQLVKALLNLSQVRTEGSLVVDPFGGSGTVLLESVLNGRDAVSIDCNPLATAVARSKVDVLDVDVTVLCDSAESFMGMNLSQVPLDDYWEQFESSTHEELESWFAPRILGKLGCLLGHARRTPDPRLVAFYEVLISDLVREVSQQEPRDLRIRRRREPLVDAPVVELFRERLQTVIRKIVAYHSIGDEVKPKRGTGQAVLGSSAQSESYLALDDLGRSIDCVVSSPPYATALPYLDTDRLSLAAVFGFSRKQRTTIERTLIGSRETSKKETQRFEEMIESGIGNQLPKSTQTFVQELLMAVRADPSAGFRRQQLPSVLWRYFLGISHVMNEIKPRMKRGSHLWFVLGNSQTKIGGKKWLVPTTREFIAIATASGLDIVEEIPITVTREDLAHSRHSITKNTIVHLRLSH